VWPTPQDYNEAVQQPQACFLDPELRKCRVELNHLGLPRPMTGAFASVYRLSNISGTSWAVRCFLEHRDDMKERYTAIKNAVNGPARELFAGFEYLERGIKVRNDWYPILKMEWIDGDSLDRYLDRHVKTRAKVVGLHKQFREMVATLKKAGIAHGDLQHGNILVTDHGLRLIDYDDMFVEGLAGKVSHELGHRNFQHPDRSNEQFHADLDNFSAWVIDLSLKALVVEPDIWRDHNGGDDCLLFRHKDFKDADDSPIFKTLTNHDETDLRDSALLFRDVLRLKPGRVPEYHSDARIVQQLLHIESVELITEAEKEIFDEGDLKPDDATIDPSFVDYDRWLASVEQRKQQHAKKTRKFYDRAKTAASVFGRRLWRFLASRVVPYAWARGVVDEGNREYDEGNLTEAVKLYTDAVVVLRPPGKDGKEFNLSRLDTMTSRLICEVLVNLGYCHIQKDQLGTAAHYFRESKSIASPKDELGQEKLKAHLLLVATYFEVDKKGDGNHMGGALNPLRTELASLKSSIDTAEVLVGAVRGEKDGPFGNSLTLPAMLTELGHDYLASGDYANAQSAYKAGMEACQWMKDEQQAPRANLIIARAACGFCSTRVAEQEIEDGIKEFCQLVDLENDADILKRLVRAELKGPLRSDWKFAELMRALGHHLAALEKPEQSKVAYTAALTVLRSCDDAMQLQMKMADCLLGMSKSMEAVAVIRDTETWTKNHSLELSGHVKSIDEFSHAIIVSTVAFDDDTHKNRYRCLDALVEKCPGPESMTRAIASVEVTDIGAKLSFAELMFELGRDLKKSGRSKVAKHAYAAAFKAFKRAAADEHYGASVMECLLAMGDSDIAANLLLDGGKLEDMVRLMVNVMVGQRDYDRGSISDLLVRVAEVQMSRPQSSVTEEEVMQTMELLTWCAGENTQAVELTREKVKRWLENREMAFAHNLVEQGKFPAALELFEKHEGPNGPNVLLVQELWILRWLSQALIDRDRGYVTVADGFAFASAVEMLANLRDRQMLTPSFAVKVAELIRSARTVGSSLYIEDIYAIFCECGRGFEHAVLSLRDILNPKRRSMIEKRLNIKGNEDVLISIADGQFEFAIVSPEVPEDEPNGESSDTNDDAGALPSVESWRQMHKTFFLIEREDYSGAIDELDKIRSSTTDRKLLSDVLVIRGYCQSLLQDDSQAERSFKEAVRYSRNVDKFRYNRASLCIFLIFQRSRDKQRHLRQLADPNLGPRDVFKIATQLVERTMNESDNLADVLALELLDKAEKGEKTTLTSGKIYRAVLSIFGITNPKRRLKIVYCLDAIGKHRAAAVVLKRYIDKSGSDDHVVELVTKLARRHIKTKELDKICHSYADSGVDFQQYVSEAREDHLVGTLSKVLSGNIPRRLLMDVRFDLIGLYGRDRLKGPLCVRVAETVESSITADTTGELKGRFIRELDGIARVISKIDPASGIRIMTCLQSATADGAEMPDPMQEDLFEPTPTSGSVS